MMRFLRFLLFAFLFISLPLISQQYFQLIENNPEQNFYQVQQAGEEFWRDQPIEERRGWKNYKRWEWFWEPRVGEAGEFPNVAKLYEDWKVHTAIKEKDRILSSKKWVQLGPIGDPLPKVLGAQGIGRVNSVRTVSGKSGLLFAGAAGGGLWKSTNYGKNWVKLPFPQFLSLGISDIAISPSNPNIIYISSGDAFGAGAVSVQVNSIGVVKSTDGGNSFFQTGFSQELSHSRILARCLVHPANPDIVYLASSDGVYKTTDGGQSWSNTFSGSFIDMEFHPENPEIIYASTRKWSQNEIYKTADGGKTWKEVRRFTSSRRIAIAVTEANPKNVYAVVANTSRAFHSFAVSYDEGENWTVTVTQNPNILGRDFGADKIGQGEYDLAIAVAPYDENLIIVGGINLWKSNDGGYSWAQISHWYGGNNIPFVHADQHDIIFDDLTGAVIVGHDGGIDLSYTEGKTWQKLNDGFTIMQFYRFSNSASVNNFILAGSQDNGTNMYRNNRWSNTYGGDGMECIINPIDPNRIYVSLYNGELRRSVDGGDTYLTMLNSEMTGESGAWVTPYVIDPQEPSTLYAGYRNVFKLSNHGTSYTKISNFTGNQQLISLAVAPSDRNVIYAGSFNTMNVTYNGGQSWNAIPGLMGGMTYIAVDPKNPRRAWFTSASYNSPRRVVEYDGTNVKDITGNLPNLAVNTLVYQNDSPDRLYIGTDAGVYYSENSSGNWIKFGVDMPNLVVTELEIQYNAKKLRAATYGGGVWETDLLECNLQAPTIQIVGNETLCPGDTVILKCITSYQVIQWSNGKTTKDIIVTEPGSYMATVFEGECQSSSKPIEIKQFTVPKMTIRATSGYPFCEGDEIDVTLQATSLFFESWQWSNGEKTNTINVTKPGKYFVQGTTKDGCIVLSDTLSVEPSPLPEKPVIIWANHNTLMTTRSYSEYQWHLDGKQISGAKNRNYTIKDSGMHSVQVFNEFKCSAFSDEFHVISSVDDISFEESLVVYPNPSQGMYYIESSDQQIKSIKVRNIFGMEIFSDTIQNSGVIDLRGFSAGIYFLEINFGHKKMTIKLIKE